MGIVDLREKILGIAMVGCGSATHPTAECPIVVHSTPEPEIHPELYWSFRRCHGHSFVLGPAVLAMAICDDG
jgi:hypothetical protein